MPKTNYYLEVPHKKKSFYRVCKELEEYGRSAFSFPNDSKKQSNLARSIGMKGKTLVERDLLGPVTVTRHRYPPTNVVILPINVKIVEDKKKNFSRFYFRRIRNKI